VTGQPSAHELLAGGFPEALDVVMTDAPRIGTISMLAAIELRRHPDGLSCDAIARRLHRRRTEVLAVLTDEPRFTRTGATRYARWTRTWAHGTEWVALRGVDAATGPPETARARRAA
jgi:hypothetical protein